VIAADDVVHATVIVVVVVVEEAFHIIIFDQIRNYAQKNAIVCQSQRLQKTAGRNMCFSAVPHAPCRTCMLGHDLWQAVQQTVESVASATQSKSKSKVL